MKTELLLLLLFIFMVCHWCQNYDCKFLTYNLSFNRIFFLFWGALSLLVCVDFLFRVEFSCSVVFTFGQTFKLGRVFNFGQLFIQADFFVRVDLYLDKLFQGQTFYLGRLHIRVIASFNLARDWCRLLRDHGNCISCSAIRKNGAVLRRKM